LKPTHLSTGQIYKMTAREKFIVLVDNDRLKKSDAIILLEGDGLNRIETTIKLYHQQWAPVIVFSGGILNLDYGSYPFSYAEPLLKDAGIANESIIHESRSLNTREQAVEIIDMAKENNWKRLILVASNFHQYRAYLTFLKVVLDEYPTLEIINWGARELNWFEQNKWGARFDLLESEFEKIALYSNHVASFEQAIDYQQWKELQP
jgi:uncharacterized SAM-binding protein YcdF (DUF218 family)